MRKFKAGDRVSATLWGEGKRGTVLEMSGSETGAIAWVVWDGHPYQSWVFPESLTLLPTLEGRP